MNRWNKSIILAGTVLMGSCSSVTYFQVPNYYETKIIQAQYKPGVSHEVRELKCSERKGHCMDGQLEKWTTHRIYNKNYYFE